MLQDPRPEESRLPPEYYAEQTGRWLSYAVLALLVWFAWTHADPNEDCGWGPLPYCETIE